MQGFRARYCNYVIMDLETHHVLSFFTAIKHQVIKKGWMCFAVKFLFGTVSKFSPFFMTLYKKVLKI